MLRDDGLPPGTLILLILRVLAAQPVHGYAIAQRIHSLSHEELSGEEGFRHYDRPVERLHSFLPRPGVWRWPKMDPCGLPRAQLGHSSCAKRSIGRQ